VSKLFKVFKEDDFEAAKVSDGANFIHVARACEVANQIVNENGRRVLKEPHETIWHEGGIDEFYMEGLIVGQRFIVKELKCEGLCEGLSHVLRSPTDIDVIKNNFCPKCGKDLR